MNEMIEATRCYYNHDLIVWANVLMLGFPAIAPFAFFVFGVFWVPYWLLSKYQDDVCLAIWSCTGLFVGLIGSILASVYYIAPYVLKNNCSTDVHDGRYFLYMISVSYAAFCSLFMFVHFFIIGRVCNCCFRPRKKKHDFFYSKV